MKKDKKKLKGKIPKNQQVYNKFLFDSHLNTMRAVELMQETISNLDNRLSLEGKAQQDQNCRLTELEELKIENYAHNVNSRLTNLEKEIKDQREDYHSHIRQLVTENEQAHKNFSAELSQVAADTNKALIALKQTNDVAQECSNKQAAELVQLRKAATLQGQHIVELEKVLEGKKPRGRPKK